MRILFALPGLHKVHRGAEVVFESVAQEIASTGGHEVTLAGTGQDRSHRAYRFRHVSAIPRERFERWPAIPFLRSEYMYEDLTFAANLAMMPGARDFDVTVTCNYPYTNWALRSRMPGIRRPAHVFVTQNGDWPAYARRREYRFFSCDGLVCTNPEFLARNRERWFSTLIPNGFDATRFRPGPVDRAALGLPDRRPVVLMVSALIRDKRVLEGMRAVARLPEAFLVVAGDGPLREEVDRLAAELLPGRFLRRTFTHDEMPSVYRSADAFLHMTLNESFGNVYIEALATGTPIVAHDGENARWILDGHARLVDTTSEQGIVLALEDALHEDRGVSAARASFARSRYTWDSVAARYLTFFSEVIDRVR